jgi:ribosome-associated protein
VNSSKPRPLAGRELVNVVTAAAVARKAEALAVYHVQGMSTLCDWHVICSGNATVHVSAVALGILTALKEQGTQPWYHEGIGEGRWAAIDYSDVIVHVMLPQVREYYAIEDLWQAGVKVVVGASVDTRTATKVRAPRRRIAESRPAAAKGAKRKARRSRA